MERKITNVTSNVNQDVRALQDNELDAVNGGTPGFPGLPLGTNINISPWSSRAFYLQWDLVGATGHLPR